MSQGPDGREWITGVTLQPKVIFDEQATTKADVDALHDESHERCYIANSVRTELASKRAPAYALAFERLSAEGLTTVAKIGRFDDCGVRLRDQLVDLTRGRFSVADKAPHRREREIEGGERGHAAPRWGAASE